MTVITPPVITRPAGGAPLLLQPPFDVRSVCCAGLTARDRLGRGGTARSVPFATRVCAGGPVTAADLADMVTHMAAIERAMETRLGDPALEVAWALWGGDTGRDWAEGFLRPAQPPPSAPEPLLAAPQPGWAARLNDLAAAERELQARVHELMEAGVEMALSRLRAKVVNALSRPPAALKSAFDGAGGRVRRDELLASIEGLGPQQAVEAVPPPLLARIVPAIDTDDTLRSVFTQLGARIRDLVGAHQRQVAAVLANAGLTEDVTPRFAADLDTALARGIDELMGLIAGLARGAANDEGEIPDGRVPGSLAFRLLSAAGGGDPGDTGRQDWALTPGGEVLCAGIAVGVTAVTALGQIAARGDAMTAAATLTIDRPPTLQVSTVTMWRWGGAARPFEPHRRLNGQSWTTEAERAEVCQNPGRFPPVGTLTPGDHQGCSCSLEVELRITQREPGEGTVRGAPRPEPQPEGPGVLAKPAGRARPPVKKPPPGWQAIPDGSLLETMARRIAPDGWQVVGARDFTARGDFAYADTPDTIGALASARGLRFTTKNAKGKTIHLEVFGNPGLVDPAQLTKAAARFAQLTEKYPVKAQPGQKAGQMLMRFAPIDGHVDGYAAIQSGRITASVDHLYGTRPSTITGTFRIPGTSSLESTIVHEWGHAAGDLAGTQEPPAAILERLAAAGGAEPRLTFGLSTNMEATRASIADLARRNGAPSTYAETNPKELVAESFTDWVFNGTRAHPASQVVAKVYGWPK